MKRSKAVFRIQEVQRAPSRDRAHQDIEEAGEATGGCEGEASGSMSIDSENISHQESSSTQDEEKSEDSKENTSDESTKTICALRLSPTSQSVADLKLQIIRDALGDTADSFDENESYVSPNPSLQAPKTDVALDAKEIKEIEHKTDLDATQRGLSYERKIPNKSISEYTSTLVKHVEEIDIQTNPMFKMSKSLNIPSAREDMQVEVIDALKQNIIGDNVGGGKKESKQTMNEIIPDFDVEAAIKIDEMAQVSALKVAEEANQRSSFSPVSSIILRVESDTKSKSKGDVDDQDDNDDEEDDEDDNEGKEKKKQSKEDECCDLPCCEVKLDKKTPSLKAKKSEPSAPDEPKLPPPKVINPKDAASQYPDLFPRKLIRLDQIVLDDTGIRYKEDPVVPVQAEKQANKAKINALKEGTEKKDVPKPVPVNAVDDYDEEEFKQLRTNIAERTKLRIRMEQGLPPYNVNTGFLSDGQRRVDLVLVVNATLPAALKPEQLEFLANLVKLGLVVEVDTPVLPRHKHLQFVKLHATELVLETYADAFRVRKLFRESHASYIHSHKDHPFYYYSCFRRERECLKILRSKYGEPLRLSNLDRSYIVYLLLRCVPFGTPANYCGLERMLRHQLLVDVFALHDGPYMHPQQRGFPEFNYRQILYLFWSGINNMASYQPVNLVYEYFGSKVAFYFVFYEFYNKALVVAALWGLVASVFYLIKDGEYMGYIRTETCNANSTTNNSFIKPNDVQCEECVGVERDRRCPMKHLSEQCLDMKLLRFFDSPYIIVYSIGMSLWAILFLYFWLRVQYYWVWLWEEELSPMHSMVRPEEIFKKELRKKKQILLRWVKFAARRSLVHVVFPSLVILVLAVFVCLFIYGFTEWIRPLSVTPVKIKDQAVAKTYRALPKIKRSLDFLFLALAVFAACFVAFGLEKLFHYLTVPVVELQHYLRHKEHERDLVLQYFAHSFLFGLIFVILYAWLKGSLYFSPVEVQDMMINFTLFSEPKNLTQISPALSAVLLRFLTWNCGGMLSCFREAVVVYFVVIFFRVFVLTAVELAQIHLSDLIHKRNEVPEAEKKPQSTVEREYSMRPVSESDINMDLNYLMVQFALIALFTPLFPLAPLIALLRNLLHIRRKAVHYLVYSRRVVVLRSKGIAHWNKVLKFICYGTPLFHALTITQTEIFKKYVFYKKTDNKYESTFIRFILSGVINRTRYAQNTATMFYRDKRIHDIYSGNTNFTNFTIAKECHVDALIKTFPGDAYVTTLWPFYYNYLEDNRTHSYYEAEFYHMKYIKVVFVIVFVLMFILVTLAVQAMFSPLPPQVALTATRERRLRSVRLHYLRPYSKVADEKNLYLNITHASPEKTAKRKKEEETEEEED